MDNNYSPQMLFYVSCNVYLAEENPSKIFCSNKPDYNTDYVPKILAWYSIIMYNVPFSYCYAFNKQFFRKLLFYLPENNQNRHKIFDQLALIVCSFIIIIQI